MANASTCTHHTAKIKCTNIFTLKFPNLKYILSPLMKPPPSVYCTFALCEVHENCSTMVFFACQLNWLITKHFVVKATNQTWMLYCVINAGTLRKRNSCHLIKDNTNLTHCPCGNSWTVTKITRCDLNRMAPHRLGFNQDACTCRRRQTLWSGSK